MENYNDLSFDKDFKKIKNMKWLPWVGVDYTKLKDKKKLLIIGDNNIDWIDEDLSKLIDKPNYVRNYINEYTLNGAEKNMPVLRNTEKLLYNGLPGPNQIKKLWSSISFFNIVQRNITSDNHSIDEDYITGWKVFFDVVKLLKPDYCLFLNVRPLKIKAIFNDAVIANHFTSDGITLLERVDHVFPKRTTITSKDGHSSKCLFIKYPAIFKWQKSIDYVDAEIGEYTAELRRK